MGDGNPPSTITIEPEESESVVISGQANLEGGIEADCPSCWSKQKLSPGFSGRVKCRVCETSFIISGTMGGADHEQTENLSSTTSNSMDQIFKESSKFGPMALLFAGLFSMVFGLFSLDPTGRGNWFSEGDIICFSSFIVGSILILVSISTMSTAKKWKISEHKWSFGIFITINCLFLLLYFTS